ncbi:11200_t:CDS:1, partial [Scutellospora calospora]
NEKVEEQNSSLILTDKVNKKKKTKRIKREKFNSDELKKYLKMKNWALVNEVNYQALIRTYSDYNECLEAIKILKKIFVTKNEIYTEIENKFSKSRSNELFKEIKDFKKNVLFWAKKNALIDYVNLKKKLMMK